MGSDVFVSPNQLVNTNISTLLRAALYGKLMIRQINASPICGAANKHGEKLSVCLSV